MCCCSKPDDHLKDTVCGTAVVPAQQLATDPVCGMTVDPANAESVEYKGAKVHFCSKGCVGKFQAEPDKYLRSKQDFPLAQVLKKDEPKAETPKAE